MRNVEYSVVYWFCFYFYTYLKQMQMQGVVLIPCEVKYVQPF